TLATTCPALIVSPGLILMSYIWPVVPATTSYKPPVLTRNPLPTTVVGMLPRKPHKTAVTMIRAAADRASQPTGVVTRMSESSCSGDDILSRDAFLKIL